MTFISFNSIVPSWKPDIVILNAGGTLKIGDVTLIATTQVCKSKKIRRNESFLYFVFHLSNFLSTIRNFEVYF